MTDTPGRLPLSGEPAVGEKRMEMKEAGSMMRMILVILMLTVLLAGSCASAEETADDGSIRPELTAVEATRLMGNGINLGNTMEACDNTRGNYAEDPKVYEVSWGQPVTTRDMLAGMKSAGFDTLRIPVAWMTNASRMPFEMKDPTLSGAYLERVREIVDDARSVGMYVIINDHWDGGWWGMFGSESAETAAFAMEAYQSMWRQIAEYFRDYSDYVIFESANEELGARFDENAPCFCRDSVVSYLEEKERYELTNRINQAFVDTVRATGGNNASRFLLIAGYGTNIAQTFDQRFRMPVDTAKNRLMVSVHYYDPWSYCGASSAAGATLWGKTADLQAMYATLSQMSRFTAQGYGVVIGEYGALPGEDGSMKPNAPLYHRAFLDCCDALDLTSCLWDTSGFFIRRSLQMGEADMAAVYAERNAASEAGRAYEEIAEAGRADLERLMDEAPESLREGIGPVTEETCMAWLMFNDGSWSVSYSVGDSYTPDSLTPGLTPTDAAVTGEGSYTVALDFTGTDRGYAENVAFAAIGISNGEQLFPDYAIQVSEVLVNGVKVKLKGRNYTCSDDGRCTRTNLFNEWVDMKTVDRQAVRVMYGDLTGISATLLDREAEGMDRIETLQVTFLYGPHR